MVHVAASIAPERSREELLSWFTDNLAQTIRDRGYKLVDEESQPDEGGIVLHPIDLDAPRSIRRRNRAIFVAGIGIGDEVADIPLKTGYPLAA